ncbi:type 1 glutamine amidotransferase [Candidatus Uhrbacteria bacterium]|nr:type 1 glutamine amidotransferase [Candidatus Uhrbacteria bacterium]
MKLSGKHIAIFAEQKYEDMELWYSYYRLTEEGATVTIVGSGTAQEYHGKYGYPAKVDKDINDVKADDFDALIIPGGFAPDYMRRSEHMVQFVRDMNTKGKIVAAICHGPWMLASAEIVSGKNTTSFFAIKSDMVHAGATWSDAEVVRDGNLITSRKLSDLPAFCRTIIELL